MQESQQFFDSCENNMFPNYASENSDEEDVEALLAVLALRKPKQSLQRLFSANLAPAGNTVKCMRLAKYLLHNRYS